MYLVIYNKWTSLHNAPARLNYHFYRFEFKYFNTNLNHRKTISKIHEVVPESLNAINTK